MKKLRTKIKKNEKIILSAFIAVFGGILIYGFIDLCAMSLFHEARHYPYRLPFEEIMCCISFTAVCPLFFILMKNIIISADNIRRKIINSVGIFAILFMLSFMFALIWAYIIEFASKKEISSYFELFVEYIM